MKGGRKHRGSWQDHEAWLAGFEELRSRIPESRAIVLGDFNQRILRKYAPRRVYDALKGAFNGSGLQPKESCQRDRH